MKNEFVKITLVLCTLLLIAPNKVNGQYTLPPMPYINDFNWLTISTPKGSSVEAGYLKSGKELTSSQKTHSMGFWMLYYNNRLIPVEDATNTYNCHGYAWNKSEGGYACWINFCTNDDFNNSPTPPKPKNIEKYWKDYSWVECSEPEAEKVWFGSYWIKQNNNWNLY